MAAVKIGRDEVAVNEFSARKALRVTKILREIGQGWPQIADAISRFQRDYEQENWVELDRATARFQYGPKPIVDDAGEYVRNDAGEVKHSEDLLAHMSDEDWEQSGQKLRLPRSPSQMQVIVHVLPLGFELAETQMLQLCALCVIGNDELGRTARDGGADAVTELLRARGEELLDQALGDQLLELLVVASEVVEQQFAAKVRELGERVGNLRRLLGLGSRTDQKTETEAEEAKAMTSSSKPASSTVSPPPTDGARSAPSTVPAGVSSSS